MSTRTFTPRHRRPAATSFPRGIADVVHQRLWPPANPFEEDPTAWVDQRLGEFLWSKQREIAEAVVWNRYVAVQSCHDAGKSYLAARMVCWWLDVWPVGSAFAVTTAPTTAQVEAILWREIGRAHRAARLPGRTTLDAKWYMGDELVAYGRKPADYDQAAFQGIHARHVLIIADEACGVPKTLFDAIDSLATNESARVLAIGNPDDPASHFAKCCAPGSGWHTIRINAFETPNFTDEPVPEELRPLLVSPTWVEERRKRWGETSPLYVSKVLGEFPEVSDDTLIQPGWIRAAQERELIGLETGQWGCDIARLGNDETCVYRNRGGVIRLEITAHKQDTMATAGQIAAMMEPYLGEVPAQIDVIGVGAGVYDRLREQGFPVIPFDASGAASPPRAGSPKFANRRAEAYWSLRELFEDGEIDIDPADEDLAAQLGSIRWFLDSRGRVHIESKDDMLKRGLPSPDRADAVMMACWQAAAMFLPVQNGNGRRDITSDLLSRAM